MSEVEAVTSTTETEPAATPENVATPTDVTETPPEETPQAEEKKSFSQSELDTLIQKEKAKAEARAERRALKVYADRLEAMQKQPVQQPAPQHDGKPTMAQFANVEDYVEAVADWKLQERDRASQQQQIQQQQQTVLGKTEKIYAEAEKIQGFDREAFDALPLTTPIAQAIIESDMSAKLMAHLTENPSEVARISTLSYARQAAEIGKLEVKLATAPKVSKAPEPITPISGRSGNATKTIFDPDLSQSEFEKLRRAQIAKR